MNSDVDTTSEQLIYKDINRGIEKVLAGMPERRRTIFLLCREEGLSHRDIASQLQISVASVEQQMNLALKALQMQQQETAVLLLLATITSVLRS